MQVDWKEVTNAAAAAVQAHVSGSQEDPASALADCLVLRTAVSKHSSELQRWSAALQIEAARQDRALHDIAEKEAQYVALMDVEVQLHSQEKELEARVRSIDAAQVRNRARFVGLKHNLCF
jgi:chromosome segregation ATPase